jgi:hypothetical protein
MEIESETPVPDVLVWLGRVTPEEACRLLVGCLLDDGSGDNADEIAGLDVERLSVGVKGGRRLLLRAVLDGVVVDGRLGTPLAAAVEECWTPRERQERADRLELGRAGILAGKLASGADREAVLVFVRLMGGGGLPGYGQRHAFYLALRAGADAGLARLGARLMRELIERAANSGLVAEDLHWRHVWFLWRAGNLVEAVEASEMLHTGGLRNPGDQKVLATTRAGALLDLFEARADGATLAKAERSLKVAYALEPGDEKVKELYRRLDHARAGRGAFR